jgi:hypothetical protein
MYLERRGEEGKPLVPPPEVKFAADVTVFEAREVASRCF